jgi:tetratricopeptide (TPR) repeat protein
VICSIQSTRKLIARSHALLYRNPAKAVALARQAMEFAVQMPEAESLKGDACRQYAQALVDCGEYHEGLAACDQADALYPLAAAYERALIALTRGRALCHLGYPEEGLVIIGSAARTLRPLDRQKFVSARTMYATALAAMSRFVAAAECFAEAAVLAQEDDDLQALAYIVNNIGFCYASTGMPELARQYLDSALVQFEQLGLTAEIPRNRTAYAKVLVTEGRFNKAISLLFEIRRTFLHLQMPVPAADTGLWLLDLLYQAGRERDVPSLAMELIDVFRSRNLPAEASRAFVYLDAATARGVRKEDVHHVRSFFGRLLLSPQATFELPR